MDNQLVDIAAKAFLMVAFVLVVGLALAQAAKEYYGLIERAFGRRGHTGREAKIVAAILTPLEMLLGPLILFGALFIVSKIIRLFGGK